MLKSNVCLFQRLLPNKGSLPPCPFDHDHAITPQDTCRRGGRIRLETRSWCVQLNRCFNRFRWSCCRIQQCWLFAHLGGQVPAREQGQGRTRYCVRANDHSTPFSRSQPCLYLDSDSVYNKTLEYVKTFAKFSTTDSASAVRE